LGAGVSFPFKWLPSGQNTNIKVRFAVTQLAQELSVLPKQDGGSAACPQYGNLDFDGDGKDDFAIFRPTLGIWAVLLSSKQQSELLIKQWGLPGDYPMPGDYTGDGKADLVVWRPTDGNWFICSSSIDFDCSQPTIAQFGLPGDSPIEGDFDGDRILDQAVWRPSNGNFYFRSSISGLVFERQWGLPGDIPLQAGRRD
jgi:hypothetical protein